MPQRESAPEFSSGHPPDLISSERAVNGRHREFRPFPKRAHLMPSFDRLQKDMPKPTNLPQVQSIFDLDPAMHKAALLYNPDSGGSRKRQSELDSALALLRHAGVEAKLILTHSSSHAEERTRQAVVEGYDTVFACGGDGTVHNIIQVLANTEVALAVLPMGTANALAHDLGLPADIVAAAQAALHAAPRRVALG